MPHNYRLVIIEKTNENTEGTAYQTDFTAEAGYGETLYDIAVKAVKMALDSLQVVPPQSAPRTLRRTVRYSGLKSPEPGTEFEFLGPDGCPNNRWSKVKRVESEDLDEKIYQVLDRYNRTYYIRHNGSNWEEVWLTREA